MEVSGSAFIPPTPLGGQDGEVATSGISRSQLDHASKLRGPSPKANIVTLIFTHSLSWCFGYFLKRIFDFSQQLRRGLSRLLTNHLGKSLGPEWHYFNSTLSRRKRDEQISE
ncbi:hypothetical protein TNCV_388591 [Trichonephila clavipes]|nr:hypothetical protein TNCV_388591 [Trichonephila clavipes]